MSATAIQIGTDPQNVQHSSSYAIAYGQKEFS